ncbi:MAG: acyltransferase [Bacteroidetes bacterium]|nr:acyltransferase [Bacteroidota bacterium]
MPLKQVCSRSFRLLDFLFRKVFRQNAKVSWAVHHTATIHHPQGLDVGVGTWPGDSPGVYINASNGVYIGDYTNLGPNVGIISGNHDLYNNDLMVSAPPIHIGRFCWLGMGAVVLPGVRLGDFTIVGAGAVVTQSFEEGYCVVAGNPARVIKKLSKDECDKQAKLRNAAQTDFA